MADPHRGGSPTLEPRDRQRPPAGGHSTGARSVGGGDGGGRKRRLFPLLGLLALIAVAALLAALLSGGDDENASNQSGQGQQESQSAQGQSGGGAGGADDGALTASGDPVLPGDAARIGDAVGQTAEGKAVVVQSVVENAEDPQALEGFWVGSSKQDRVYVEWGGDVGGDEADFRPEAGQRVSLTGPVKAAPEKAARVLNLDKADAELVQRQGAYVNADEVTAAE